VLHPGTRAGLIPSHRKAVLMFRISVPTALTAVAFALLTAACGKRLTEQEMKEIVAFIRTLSGPIVQRSSRSANGH
jgi:hypothetical protein